MRYLSLYVDFSSLSFEAPVKRGAIMTMWSTEWMVLYSLAIVIGNLAVIAIASRANRQNSRTGETENADQLQELNRDPSKNLN